MSRLTPKLLTLVGVAGRSLPCQDQTHAVQQRGITTRRPRRRLRNHGQRNGEFGAAKISSRACRRWVKNGPKDDVCLESGLPPNCGHWSAWPAGLFRAISRLMHRSKGDPSLNHLVGGSRAFDLRHFEAEALAVLKLITSSIWSAAGRAGRSGSHLQNPPGVNADLTIGIRNAGAVAHQATGQKKNARARRQRMASRQRDDHVPDGSSRTRRCQRAARRPRVGRMLQRLSRDRGPLLTSRMRSCCPSACAAACTSLRSASVLGMFGFTSMAIVVALGTNWRSSSNRFAPNTLEKKLTPVTLPPGRLRLATRPSRIGSLPVAKTIGTVVVAALAASAGARFPMNTATGRRSKSATRAGSRSI